MLGKRQGGHRHAWGRVAVAGVLLAAFLTTASSAWAKSEKLSSEQIKTLKSILSCMSYVGTGIDGKPTVRFEGCNVQVVAGAKETETTGVGNLVIGNDETPHTQSGSNNLVIGSPDQEYTGTGAIQGGFGNKTTGEDNVVFGGDNTSSGRFATVTGGQNNLASGYGASILGGEANTASNYYGESTIAGGYDNTADAYRATVSGGVDNLADNEFAAVSGGEGNVASGKGASVAGGFKLTASLADEAVL